MPLFGPPVSTGTYTPTITSVANLDSTPTVAGTATWVKVGNTVQVAVAFEIDPTTTATVTQFRFSLPFASNFAASGDVVGATGTAFGTVQRAYVLANAATDTVLVDMIPANTGASNVQVNLMYRILV